MFGRLSTHYLRTSSYVRSRNSDATWLLPALNPQLPQEVKEQLRLSIDRNRKIRGEESRQAGNSFPTECLDWISSTCPQTIGECLQQLRLHLPKGANNRVHGVSRESL